MSRLDNEGLVVTGGASGIGEVITRGQLAEGRRVVVAALQVTHWPGVISIFRHLEQSRRLPVQGAIQ